MKSNTKLIQSLPIGSDTRDMLMLMEKDSDYKRELCREGLAEWLIKFGTRWVQFNEIGSIIALGYPEREKYLERKVKTHFRDGPYLNYRLTQKGLDFINDRQADT